MLYPRVTGASMLLEFYPESWFCLHLHSVWMRGRLGWPNNWALPSSPYSDDTLLLSLKWAGFPGLLFSLQTEAMWSRDAWPIMLIVRKRKDGNLLVGLQIVFPSLLGAWRWSCIFPCLLQQCQREKEANIAAILSHLALNKLEKGW